MANSLGPETFGYASQLLADVVDHAETEGQEAFLAEAFTDLVLDDFEQEGLWPDYQLCHFRQRGLELAAWGLDEVSRVLYVAVTDFVNTNEPIRLPLTEERAKCRRLEAFIGKGALGQVDLPEHSPVLDLAVTLENGAAFDSIALFLLTNRSSGGEVRSAELGLTYEATWRTWDLEALRRFRQSGEKLEPIRIDFEDRYGRGIPVLESPQEFENVRVLLAFVPGQYLADIYNEFGPRLLERNVRSFLMARGKINRGIRDTLRGEPAYFLAYNNGITATASRVELKKNDHGFIELVGIDDLQIVNGGQTTASIAVAGREEGVSLANVSIQMKLAVVSPELLDDLVPNISRYANRQNAVQESDLSANHPHLRRLQSVSRSEWTPLHATGASTKWYFERARGSYNVEKSESGGKADQKRFVSHYPPSQKFTKNQLAIYEMTWAKLPHIVCRGGQKSFAAYMERTAPSIFDVEHDTDETVEIYRGMFRDVVAKGILFKSTDALVRKELGGTYKRQVVAYTASYLLEHSIGKVDLAGIWDSQQLSPGVSQALSDIAGPVKQFLIASGEGWNITEWTKQEACWEKVRIENFDFSDFDDIKARIEADQRILQRERVPNQRVQLHSEKGQRSLAESVEDVFGERIDGKWRRFRRKKWRHIGDTGIMAASGQATYHAFSADFQGTDGMPYTLDVVVDFPARLITPLEQLPTALRSMTETAIGELDGR